MQRAGRQSSHRLGEPRLRPRANCGGKPFVSSRRSDQHMRLIRRLLILTFLGVAGVAAYAQWSDNGAALRAKAAGFARETAKREAGEFASKAADKASGTFSDAALTAKIKSKMALDDHVKARAIDIDTSGGVATLSGVVRSE